MTEQTLDTKKKFAIIGTSSAGKTTLTLRLLADLKRLGVLVDAVLQQDRRLGFERDKLETDVEAQYAVIFNMVVKECEMLLKDGVEIVLSDRSVLDFYAYYEYMYGRSDYLWDFVVNWCKTYSTIYYLEPLAYHDDGNRPSNDFRLNVDKVLLNLIDELEVEGVEVQKIDRSLIYKDILQKIKRLMSFEELSFIPCVLQQDVLVGGSYAFNRATRFSDVDVYILGDAVNEIDASSKKLRGVFGANMEVRSVPKPIWDYYRQGGFLFLPYTTSLELSSTQTGGNCSLPLVKKELV